MKRLLVSFVACILAIAALGVYFITHKEDDTAAEEIPTARVERGPFTIAVREVGVLKALKSTSVTMSFTGRYWERKLTRLVDEETVVKEGDPIAWLDTTDIKQRKLQWDSQLKGYRAMKEKHLQRLNLQREDGEVDVKLAHATRDFSETELDEAKALEDKYEMLAERGLIAQKTVRDQQKEVRNKDYALGQAGAELTKSLINQEAQARVIKTEILEADARFSNAERETEEIDRELDASVVKAPVSGMVLYASRGRDKIKEGDEVWPHYPLATIPDLSEFRIASQVEEVEIGRVHVGQKAEITVDALPELKFDADIEYISQLAIPREQSLGTGFVDKEERTGVRVFETTLKMSGTDKALRPGMTVGVNIVIGKLDDVLFVPSKGVFKRGDSSFVYLKHGNRVVERDVVLGDRNDKSVVIVQGLKEGDEILLEEPTQPLEKVKGVSSFASR
jgi:RND family efflux transporter MFP subunit